MKFSITGQFDGRSHSLVHLVELLVIVSVLLKALVAVVVLVGVTLLVDLGQPVNLKAIKESSLKDVTTGQ